MSRKNRILLCAFGWADYPAGQQRNFKVGFIPVTCHLAGPVTDSISGSSKESVGEFRLG